MKRFQMTTVFALLVSASALTLPACSQQSKSADADGAAAPTRGAFGETVSTVADQPIPNVAGKRLVSKLVEYAPGGSSVSHRHARSAFIYAYVVSGAVRSQVNDEPERVYQAGEFWFEKPGSHHRVSANASATEPAKLLATFIVDVDEKELTTPDAP